MRINVVTSFNGRGLERDAEIIEALIACAGHTSRRVQWDQRASGRPADLNICLETMPIWVLDLAPRTWVMPNPEWWNPPWTPYLSRVERVLCKTREAIRIFSALTSRAEYLGFGARDRMDAGVPRERSFFCAAGVSVAKGADVVVEAWRRYSIPHPLTVTGKLFAGHEPVEGVTFAGHVSDAEMRRLQNACTWHLQPSWTEGFGMAIHEALSCGALVAVPDFPPMSEWPGCALRIPIVETRTQRIAPTCRVSPEGVRDAALALAALGEAEAERLRAAAARQSVEEREAFETRMLELLTA